MATVPFPVVGPTYTNRSLPVSSQITQNFYVQVNPQGTEPVALVPFPGLKLFANTGNGASRGTGVLNDVFYAVTGNTLYSISAGKVVTSRGTIGGSGRCQLVSDGTNLVITTGSGKPYTWNGTTLTQGSDADLPNAATVAYINRRVVYDGSGTDVAFADLDTPLSVNSANVTRADTKADDMVAVFAHNQQIFAAGTDSIEPYYNSGAGNPPYLLIQNAVKDIGITAPHSIAQNVGFTYFLGSDRVPYRLSGLNLQGIGNPAIGQALAGYTNVDSAYGLCFSLDNEEFYLLTFPNDATWLFSESSNLWTSLAFGVNGAPHLIGGYENIYGKHLVSDRASGKIYELDFDTYTDNGELIQHQRDTISIDGGTFGREDARVFMSRLRVRIEPGTSLVSAESQMMMQYSDDNGRSWSGERWSPIGLQGDYTYIVEWLGLGMFYRRQFRFRMSDNINWVLIGASVDVDIGNG